MINDLKTFTFLILCFLCTCIGYSQTFSLKGIVTDSVQNPLEFATVMAQPIDSLHAMKYAITEDLGYYRLNLKKDITYIVSFSYLGYKTVEFTITSSNNTEKDVILKEETDRLKEVLIELPIIVKPDTIIYWATKFVTGEERKLKEVLKKLPGVEVDKDGSVRVRGKKVTHMLVEGKRFFGGGSKLAVENIPADAVENVVVIDDYNEVAFLKGLTDTDDMAMDIELKEDKKEFVFGDVEVGKGDKSYYRAHSNLFYYHPEINVNFIGNLNNTGEKTFTYKDFMSFQGGYSSVFNHGNSIFSSSSDFSQFMKIADVTSSENKMGALNITKAINDKLDVSGYLIFSHSNTENFEESNNQYTTPDFNYIEDKTNEGSTRNVLSIGKVNIEYSPKFNEQWYLRTQVKSTNNFNDASILSKIDTDTRAILTTKDAEGIYINQNLEWHKKLSEKHTFSFTTNLTYDKNNPNSYWETNEPILQGLIPLTTVENYKLTQLKQLKRTNWNLIFKHYWVLNSNNHLYSTFGNEYVKDQFYTNDSQQLENGTTIDFTDDGFGNDLNYMINDLYVGIHYKFKKGIVEFKQGAFVHKYTRNISKASANKDDKFLILPDFSTKIEFSKTKSIRIRYNLKSSFSDVSKLANRFYLQSYNSVYRGNEQLENELSHFINILYSRFSLYRGLRLYGGVNYTKKVKGIQNLIQTEGVDSYLSPVMADNPGESLNGNLTIDKTVKNIKYHLKTRIYTSKSLENINSNIITNKSTNASYEFSVKTLHKKYPILEVGFKQSLGNYVSSYQTSKFSTNEPFVTIDYDFLEKFIFSFDYTHFKYQNKSLNLTNTYNLTNAMISYGKENSAWTFKMNAQNLLNVKFKNRNSFNTYVISDKKTYVLPRIIMLTVVYKL